MRISVVSSSRKIMQTLGSELEKLVTLPLIWLTLMVAFLANMVLAAAFSSAGLQGTSGAGTQSILNTGLASMGYLQAGFIILGILAACSEYENGQIRTTLTAMPWRGFQLSMKYVALAILTVPAALIIAASGVFYSFIMMKDAAAAIEMNKMIEALAGAAGYLTITTLISAAVGALLRRTTPALALLIGYYFIVSPLSEPYLPRIFNYFPDAAGYYMYMKPASDDINTLTAMQGTGIAVVWAMIFMAGAIAVYHRRDA
jgi:ABC-2 type transport system permease protein